MKFSLLLTACFMGLMGAPHCLGMCGASCTGIGAMATPPPLTLKHNTFFVFFQLHLGRIISYAGLGALAATAMQGIGWLSTFSHALRPLWSFVHLSTAILGIFLLLRGVYPVWLEHVGKRTWYAAQKRLGSHAQTLPLIAGFLWALLPCGLLYSAVMLAGLAGLAWQGALVMVAFALGTTVTLTIFQFVLLKLNAASHKTLDPTENGEKIIKIHQKSPKNSDNSHQNQLHQGFYLSNIDWQSFGVRLSGLMLFFSAIVALWLGLFHNQAPWCVTH